VNRGTVGVNSLPKTVTRQRRDCDLNPGRSAPESSTLTTRLPSHPPGSQYTVGETLIVHLFPAATTGTRVRNARAPGARSASCEIARGRARACVGRLLLVVVVVARLISRLRSARPPRRAEPKEVIYSMLEGA